MYDRSATRCVFVIVQVGAHFAAFLLTRLVLECRAVLP
jgi:hypothetical protein